MKIIVILIGKFIVFVGKIFKRGTSLPGKVALMLDKNIINKLTLPEDIIIVTGSNGKTSTTEMIASTLRSAGKKAIYNEAGSNQIEGVTTVLLKYCNLKGVVKADALVLESDERYTRNTTKYIKPKYMIVTNLYRDQMTRNGHPEVIYDIIKEAIDENVHLILNTDDPLSSLYGYKRDNVTYVGIEKNDLSKIKSDSVYLDTKYCPNCKSLMKYDYYHFNHIGSYECPNCGHKRHNPEFKVSNIDFKTGVITINDKYTIKMNLNSIYNAYNLLFTFAICSLMGISEEEVRSSLDNYIIKNDRVQSFKINNNDVMLLTSKHENSISYNQSLTFIKNQNKECAVVILVDAISRKYFTSETSWLWDIDFELLNSKNVKKVIVAGTYKNDILIRLKYASISEDKIYVSSDLDDMMDNVKNNDYKNVYVVTCFSDRMKFLDRR